MGSNKVVTKSWSSHSDVEQKDCNQVGKDHKNECVNKTMHVMAENAVNLGQKRPCRFVYNSNSKPSDNKSLMVRPLKYSFMVFRSATNDVTRRSYASVLKTDKNKLRCHDSSTKVIPGTTINNGSQDNANKQANDSFKSSHVSGPECDGLQETEHLIMNHVGDNSSDGGPVIYDSHIANDDEGGVHNDPVSIQ